MGILTVQLALIKRLLFFDNFGKILWFYQMDNIINSVSVSSHGLNIALSVWDNKIYVFDRVGKPIWNYKTNGNITAMSFSSDGSYIAAGSRENTELSGFSTGGKNRIYLFDIDGNLLWNHDIDISSMDIGIGDISVSNDGSLIAIVTHDSKIYIFNRNGELTWSHKIDNVSSTARPFVAISNDGTYIAAKFHGENIYFFVNILRHSRRLIEETKSIISLEKSKGFNMEDEESLILRADQAFIEGDYRKAKQLADEALKKITDGMPSRSVITNAINVIEKERRNGFNVETAEEKINLSKQALDLRNYDSALELANLSKTIALDIDNDGIPNEFDIIPTIPNSYAYGGVLFSLFSLAFIFITTVKVRGRMNERRRKAEEERRRREQEERLRNEKMKRAILDRIEEATKK